MSSFPFGNTRKEAKKGETAASLHNKLSASGIQHIVLHHGLLKTQFRSKVFCPVSLSRAAMNVKSGDILDMLKKSVGRSARQVSRDHARNRETYHHPTQRQGPGAVMGDSVPYQLFLIRATDAMRCPGFSVSAFYMPSLPSTTPPPDVWTFPDGYVSALGDFDTGDVNMTNTAKLPPPGQRQGGLIALTAHR